MSGTGGKRASGGDSPPGPPEKKTKKEEKTTTTLIEPIRIGGVSSTVSNITFSRGQESSLRNAVIMRLTTDAN